MVNLHRVIAINILSGSVRDAQNALNNSFHFPDERPYQIIQQIINHYQIYTDLVRELTNERAEQIAGLSGFIGDAINGVVEINNHNAIRNSMNNFIQNYRSGNGALNVPQQGRNVRRRLNMENVQPQGPPPPPQGPPPPGDFVENTVKKWLDNKERDNECNICYSELWEEPVCILWKCGHIFHCRCINNYQAFRPNDNNCPKCREYIFQKIQNIQLPNPENESNGFGKRKKSKLNGVIADIKYLSKK